MSTQSDIAREFLAQKGFVIPEVDLQDIANATHDLSEVVARQSASLGTMDVDLSFVAALQRFAPPALQDDETDAEVNVSSTDAHASEMQVMESLARIQSSPLGALTWGHIDSQGVISQARALDEERDKGRVRGPLHGMPIGLKDMFDRRGHVAGWGSPMRQHAEPATEDATIVTRLEQAGLIILGAQHMAEFAMSPTGLNASLGPGLNPWNHEHVSGGSSSGAGMSVADGHVQIAIGSDTGGSVRLPAAFCGITGLKPTQYRLSLAGAMPLSPSLDCIGVLANSVELCGHTFSAMAGVGVDSRDPLCMDRPALSSFWSTASATAFTVAVPRLAQGPYLSEDMLHAFEATVQVLREAGVKCVDVDLPDLDLLGRMGSTILAVESSSIHRQWLKNRADEYGRQVRRRLSRGLLMGAMDYYDALRLRAPMLQQFVQNTLNGADALLIPTIPDVAPLLKDTVGADETRLEQEFSALSYWTRGTNYLGVPALSVPAGTGVRDLPLGVQFLGAPFAEDRLLAIGHIFQQHTDWHAKVPTTRFS